MCDNKFDFLKGKIIIWDLKFQVAIIKIKFLEIK
jgi:hypothetical protein